LRLGSRGGTPPELAGEDAHATILPAMMAMVSSCAYRNRRKNNRIFPLTRKPSFVIFTPTFEANGT
jgi:hypothetical protein